mgnify:CR=1 FL=1
MTILCELDMRLKGQIGKDDTPLTIVDIQKRISGWGEICNMGIDDPTIAEHEHSLLQMH